MKNKVQKILPLILILAVAIIFVLISGCTHKTLEGELVNAHSDAGRTNSYEKYGEFLKQSFFNDKYELGNKAGAIVPTLSLSNQENVFATTDGRIMMLIPDTVMWQTKLDAGSVVNGLMCADEMQNIYAVSNIGEIYSFNYDGKRRWKVKITDDTLSESTLPCDLLAVKGGILAGTTNGLICKYSFEGKLLWKKNFPTGIDKTLSALDDNPVIAISSANDMDTLAMLSPNGEVKWKVAADVRFVKYPVVSKKAIYIAGMKYAGEEILSHVSAYDFNGKLIWQKFWSFVPRTISVSEDNEIYVNVFKAGLGDQVSGIFKLDSHGKILWKKFFRYIIPTPVMIAKNSLAFLGVTHNTVGLYFLDREKGEIYNVQSFSNELPIMHSATVRPDGAIAFPYYQNVGFLRVDDSWFHKILPW